jgi:hypothetical protein
MGVLAMTAVLAALAAPLPTPQVELPELRLPNLPEVQLPEVQVPDVQLPEVRVPDVPAPEVTPPAVPSPAAPAPGAPAAGSEPRAATAEPPPAAASTPGTAEASSPTTRPSRTAATRPARRAERRRSGRRETAAARRADRARPAGRERRAAATEPASASPRPSPVTVAAAEEPGPGARIADDLVELAKALPAAVLLTLLGTAGLALLAAGDAYWQSRQRRRLEAQRTELLGDIGLLSRALLPPVPAALDGLAVSAAYRPADGPAAGGDFYDVFALDGDRIGVLLGDVSGHGRDSVTQAALARYTLRTLLAAGHAPGEALARADALLARDLRPDFVTVIAAVYDRGELTYAKAGHPPPIVVGAAHDPAAEPTGPPLGLGVGAAWPEVTLALGDGVSVCLYTDGLEDARGADGRLGREQVDRLLRAQDEPDAARLLGDVGALAEHVGDDTAAIVLRAAVAPAA